MYIDDALLIFSDSKNYLELSTQEPTATVIVERHIVRCYKSGYIQHPTDEHKYIDCKPELIKRG